GCPRSLSQGPGAPSVWSGDLTGTGATRHNAAQDDTSFRNCIGPRVAAQLRTDFLRLLLAPDRVRYTSKPIDCEGLHREENHCDLDDDKFFGLGDDTE